MEANRYRVGVIFFMKINGEEVNFAAGATMAGEFLEHRPLPDMDDKIAALVTEVAPPGLVVSETAIAQLRPLLVELILRREGPQ